MSRETFTLPKTKPDSMQQKYRSALTPSVNKEKTGLLQLDAGEGEKD